MKNGPLIMINGALAPAGERHVSALDRGFALADGIFETLRVSRGRPFQLAAHLARLHRSAAAIDLPLPAGDGELAQQAADLLRANGLQDAVLRLTVTRGVPADRGLLPPAQPQPTIVWQTSPLHEPATETLARGFRIRTSSIRRNEHSPTAGIKSCNYLDNILARMEAHGAGADDALLLNTAGELACCSAANFFLVDDEGILTPPLECGVLAGITRDLVRQLSSSLGLRWREQRLSPSDVSKAREAFLTNSVLGVIAVTSVDGRPVGAGQVGAVFLQLRREHESLVRAE